MKILGCFLFYLAICSIEAGFTIPRMIVFAIFLAGGIKCFTYTREKKNRSSSYTGIGGRIQGDITDLGNGQKFDRHHPDDIVGVNWRHDGQEGFYCPGTGEHIRYNNGRYDYYTENHTEF